MSSAPPDFGVDSEDSAKLLELYQAIDAIGWNSQADEERGDYLGRLKQIREELASIDTVRGRCIRLTQKIRRQRIMLRRFNREAQAVSRTMAHIAARKLHPDQPVLEHHRRGAHSCIGASRPFEIAWCEGRPVTGALPPESSRQLRRLQALAQAFANEEDP
jgi:hypothetical protein